MRFSCVSRPTNEYIKNIFGWFSEKVSAYPGRTCGSATILTLCLIFPIMFKFRMETDLASLYIPRRGDVWNNHKFYETHFQNEGKTDFAWLLFSAPNVVTPYSLGEMTAITHEALGLRSGGIAWENVCARKEDTGSCKSQDIVFSLWNFNASLVGAMSQEAISQMLFAYRAQLGPLFNANFANVQLDNALRKVRSSTAYWVQLDLGSDRESNMKWLNALMDYCSQVRKASKKRSLKFEYLTSRSSALETSRTVVMSIPLFVAAILIMVCLLMATLDSYDFVKLRFWLSIGFVFLLVVVLIGAVGLGVMVYPINSLCLFIPFILTGVAVDDLLLIVAMMNAQRSDSASVSLKDALSAAGSSLCVTSLTTVVGFLFGMMVDIPGARAFSFYGAATFVVVFLLQFLIFVPFLICDNKRVKEERCCLCFCTPRARCSRQVGCFHSVGNFLSSLREKLRGRCNWVECLSGKLGIPLMLLVFGFFVFSVVVRPHVAVSQGVADHVPDDSYYKSMQDEFARQFNDGTPRLEPLVLRGIDWTRPSSFSQYEVALLDMRKLPNIHVVYLSWPTNFMRFVNQTSNVSAAFGSRVSFQFHLEKFLSKFPRYRSSIKLDDTRLTMSRVFLISAVSSDLQKYWTQTEEAHRIIQTRLTKQSFITSDRLLWAVFLSVVREYTLRTIRFRMIGVVIVLLLFLPVDYALLCAATVFMVDMSLFGWMYIWKLPLNVLSYIMIVVSLGIVVDFNVHIATHFCKMLEDATVQIPSKQMKDVLSHVGLVVLKGFFTTLMGSVPCFFVRAKIFHDFFIFFVGVILIAVVYALVFLPRLLRCYTEIKNLLLCFITHV